jgi:ribosomal protein S18 acetylase RimI-like enzyme
VLCALELIDAAAQPSHPDYQALVAVRDERVLGYVCFGPTPMTQGTFDLYWIASAPDVRGQGVGKALVEAMEAQLKERRARIVRVETSALESYGSTRGFYAAMRYVEEARIRDFYRAGEDLVILAKRL